MCPMGEKDVRNRSLNAQLYEALLKEDAEKVKELCAKVDEQGLHILTIHDDTVLQAATYSNQSDLVLSLLDSLPDRHLDKMTRQNLEGHTILHDAAASNSSQSLDVAKKVLQKAPGLLCIRNHLGETALFRAVSHGNKEMFDFFVQKISGYNEANRQPFLQRSDKTTILHMAILVQHFELALEIATRYEHLVGERDVDGMTGLQLLSCNPGAFRREPKKEFLDQIVSSGSFRREPEKEFLDQIVSSVNLYCTSARRVEAENLEKRYKSAVELAKFLIKEDTSWDATYPGINQNKPRLHKYGSSISKVETLMSSLSQGEKETGTPLFLATKSGCVEITTEILKKYPQAVEHIDEKGRNILHVAIKYRQFMIFETLVKDGVPMKRLVRKIDNEGNSILHTVGLKIRDYVPEKMQGPALKLQEELIWFERVKKVLPPHLVDHRNNMKQTAEGLFAITNKELRKASIEWLKRTSEGCSIVAVLIATVAFAAAYTVPGGPNNETGIPVLFNQPFFVVFTVTDVLSLSFALTSVVIFLSILTSPFRLANFKHSLPNKLMLGFTFLFLSVSMMMVAFAATILLMLHKGENWRKILLYALSFLPVGIFAISYFPLYRSLSETYKYLLNKTWQAIPWSCWIPVQSRLTNLFSYCKSQTSNSSNPPQPQCVRSTMHNRTSPETSTFSV